jgi:hypothetical protein
VGCAVTKEGAPGKGGNMGQAHKQPFTGQTLWMLGCASSWGHDTRRVRVHRDDADSKH